MRGFQYYYYYSSEEFSAFVVKTKGTFTPDGEDPDYKGHWYGPFDRLRDARGEVLRKISGDIREFKAMRLNVHAVPEER